MKKVIIVKDIVTSTSINEDGTRLYEIISKDISIGNQVQLSLSGIEIMSSSFMNSSFGVLIDSFGLSAVKKNISLINYKPTLANRIKDYLNRYSIPDRIHN